MAMMTPWNYTILKSSITATYYNAFKGSSWSRVGTRDLKWPLWKFCFRSIFGHFLWLMSHIDNDSYFLVCTHVHSSQKNMYHELMIHESWKNDRKWPILKFGLATIFSDSFTTHGSWVHDAYIFLKNKL